MKLFYHGAVHHFIGDYSKFGFSDINIYLEVTLKKLHITNIKICIHKIHCLFCLCI